jgi:hypothetical protein
VAETETAAQPQQALPMVVVGQQAMPPAKPAELLPINAELDKEDLIALHARSARERLNKAMRALSEKEEQLNKMLADVQKDCLAEEARYSHQVHDSGR